MSCLINNLNDLSNLNNCSMSVAGIKKIFIAPFDNTIYSKLTIFNNQITKIDSSIRFIELDFNKSNSKVSDLYNYNTKKYEITLNVELNKVDYNKRNAIDALVKSKMIIIYQDMNGKFYLLGEKAGISSNNYTSTTDVYRGNSNYTFTFVSKSDYIALGVSPDVVKEQTNINCSDIWNELALSSFFFWYPYRECLVGDFPNFINP